MKGQREETFARRVEEAGRDTEELLQMAGCVQELAYVLIVVTPCEETDIDEERREQ